MATRFQKDPDAKLDFTFDWSDWLSVPLDTIASVVFIVATGLVLETTESGFDGALTTVWVSGGTAGVNYDVVHRITTADGRIDDRTMTIAVKEK